MSEEMREDAPTHQRPSQLELARSGQGRGKERALQRKPAESG
eukprot:CAMPEP_0119175296 /NCGR_PEP_ID=MMETSP1315-20130426/41598_1 /TAXON_ID=676789 /ORGANISM="Prasinoderma singularis, Strain RCC927" /LENGTH=41 /DNA_ID= /DNA_START= /DNA_END= /DNA_ORIENTATION=